MEHLDRRGTGNLADSGILCFLITVLFMGQYIKEPMRREQEAGMKSELSSRDKRIPGKIQRKLRTVRQQPAH